MSYSGEGTALDDQRVWDGSKWVLVKRPLTQAQSLTATGNWNGVADYILVSGAGTKTITLPPPSTVPRNVTIIDADGTASSNIITVVAQGGGTISGNSSVVMNTAHEVLPLVFISTSGSGAWARTSADSLFRLAEGFQLNVLPEQSDRGSIATTLTDTTAYALTDGFWYSLTVEILVEDPTADEQYVYRSVVECFRDGGGAEIHTEAVAVEEPVGGNWTTTVSANANNIEVEIDNQAANTINFARYLGATRKAMP